MKPAVGTKRSAILIALLVGGFALWWYFRPFPWLGVIMATFGAGFTYFILSTQRMERFRRALFISLFVLALTSLIIIIATTGLDTFMRWVADHSKEYYIQGQTIGAQSYPCTREVPQVFLGRAVFLPGLGLWSTRFPSSLNEFMLLMVPFVVTGLIFGRGFCGWICPFGGLNEAMVTGEKERWRLRFLKKEVVSESGFRYAGLKPWVKDVKYGVLAGVVLLSISLAFPIVCIFCPVLWLSAMPVFWTVIGVIAVFAVVLPFMTKRRWWCHICPMGAFYSLLDKISLFRVKIDKQKCTRCFDCVQECRMYALTTDAVQERLQPDADCIRCGRCIEACPEGAGDIYWLGTSRKVRALFLTLAIVAVLAWYIWFVVILADNVARLF